MLNIYGKGTFYFSNNKYQLTFFGSSIDEYRKGGNIKYIDDPYDPESEHIDTERYEYGIRFRSLQDKNFLNIDLIKTTHKRFATNSSRPFNSDEENTLFDFQFSSFFKKNTNTFGATRRDDNLNEVINLQEAPDKKAKTRSIYIQDELKIGKRLEIVLGGRYDQFETTFLNDSSFSPRVSGRFKLNNVFSFRLGLGSGFRIPYLFSEDLHLCSAAPIIYNSGKLSPEKARSFNFDVEHISQNIYFDLSYFNTEINDKIYYTEEGAPLGFDYIWVNGGKAKTEGFEAISKFKISKNFETEYFLNLTKAEYLEEEDYGVGKSKKIMRVPEYSMKFILKITSYDYGLNFNLKLEIN